MSGAVYRTPLRTDRGLELIRYRSAVTDDIWFTVYIDGIEVASYPELKEAARLYDRIQNGGYEVIDEGEHESHIKQPCRYG